MVKTSTVVGIGAIGVLAYLALRPKQEQQGGGGGFSFGIPFFNQAEEGTGFGGGEPFSFTVEPLSTSLPQTQPSSFNLNDFLSGNDFFNTGSQPTNNTGRKAFLFPSQELLGNAVINAFSSTPKTEFARKGIFALPNIFDVFGARDSNEKRFVATAGARGESGSGALSSFATKKEATVDNSSIAGFTSDEEASRFMSIAPTISQGGGSSSRRINEVGSSKKKATQPSQSQSLFLGTQANASSSQSQGGGSLFARIARRFTFIF